jgi:hypothetical protein
MQNKYDFIDDETQKVSFQQKTKLALTVLIFVFFLVFYFYKSPQNLHVEDGTGVLVSHKVTIEDSKEEISKSNLIVIEDTPNLPEGKNDKKSVIPTEYKNEIDCKRIKLKKNGKKIIFSDLNGRRLIKKSYYDANNFFDCFTAVKTRKNGPIDIIDCNGNVITDRIEDFDAIGEFHEGLAAAHNYDGKFVGYVNIHARLKINLQWLFPDENFQEGSVFADSKCYLFYPDGGFLQIDTIGRVIRKFKP